MTAQTKITMGMWYLVMAFNHSEYMWYMRKYYGFYNSNVIISGDENVQTKEN